MIVVEMRIACLLVLGCLTPALSDGMMYVRGLHHIFAVGRLRWFF